MFLEVMATSGLRGDETTTIGANKNAVWIDGCLAGLKKYVHERCIQLYTKCARV